jgi:hypothetical protein
MVFAFVPGERARKNHANPCGGRGGFSISHTAHFTRSIRRVFNTSVLSNLFQSRRFCPEAFLPPVGRQGTEKEI